MLTYLSILRTEKPAEVAGRILVQPPLFLTDLGGAPLCYRLSPNVSRIAFKLRTALDKSLVLLYSSYGDCDAGSTEQYGIRAPWIGYATSAMPKGRCRSLRPVRGALLFGSWMMEFKTREESYWYWRGVRDGLRRFAWWKDGVEMVGSCGTTLKKALEDIHQEEAGDRTPVKASCLSMEREEIHKIDSFEPPKTGSINVKDPKALLADIRSRPPELEDV